MESQMPIKGSIGHMQRRYISTYLKYRFNTVPNWIIFHCLQIYFSFSRFYHSYVVMEQIINFIKVGEEGRPRRKLVLISKGNGRKVIRRSEGRGHTSTILKPRGHSLAKREKPPEESKR